MLAIKYTIFAVISTLVNLLFQYFSFGVYAGFGSLYVAMFFGTLAGLVAKYILDKKFIFYHKVENKKMMPKNLHSIHSWVSLLPSSSGGQR